MQQRLTAERLRQLLTYDAETGVFRWRIDRGRGANGAKAGDIAGCEHTDRRNRHKRWQIVIDRTHYKAHRLAWLYVHGRWPKMLLDHKNGDGCDNRLANLREATPAANMANSRHPRGATNYRGVSFYRNGYMAQISHKGRSLYLGRFATAEEAHEAWCSAARTLRGDFARTD